MELRIETRRWRRIRRLFIFQEGRGIEEQTRRLSFALAQVPPCDTKPLIQTWNDMAAIIESIVAEAGKELPR
jgi:hypothetical protein